MMTKTTAHLCSHYSTHRDIFGSNLLIFDGAEPKAWIRRNKAGKFKERLRPRNNGSLQKTNGSRYYVDELSKIRNQITDNNESQQLKCRNQEQRKSDRYNKSGSKLQRIYIDRDNNSVPNENQNKIKIENRNPNRTQLLFTFAERPRDSGLNNENLVGTGRSDPMQNRTDKNNSHHIKSKGPQIYRSCIPKHKKDDTTDCTTREGCKQIRFNEREQGLVSINNMKNKRILMKTLNSDNSHKKQSPIRQRMQLKDGNQIEDVVKERDSMIRTKNMFQMFNYQTLEPTQQRKKNKTMIRMKHKKQESCCDDQTQISTPYSQLRIGDPEQILLEPRVDPVSLNIKAKSCKHPKLIIEKMKQLREPNNKYKRQGPRLNLDSNLQLSMYRKSKELTYQVQKCHTIVAKYRTQMKFCGWQQVTDSQLQLQNIC